MWGKKKISIYFKLLDAVKDEDELEDYKMVDALISWYIGQRDEDEKTVIHGLISMFRGKSNTGNYIAIASIEMTLWITAVSICVNVYSNLAVFYMLLILGLVLILLKADPIIRRRGYKSSFVLTVLELRLESIEQSADYVVHITQTER